ncbi:MAG: hypothetical protein F6K42_31340 [Leptolyngbya sp. SIO1D8]|nr:hypothetical protein [Leptolyngbya sp. SIO1D8]
MDKPFLAATTTTLILAYLSIRSQAIWSLLCLVLAFFTLLLSLALAPGWFRLLILLAGLWWSYQCPDSTLNS